MDCMGLASPNDFQAFKHFYKRFQENHGSHRCLAGFRDGGGEGRSSAFVLSDRPTGQKQGEGECAEGLRSTLDRSHRSLAQRAGEVDQNCVTLGVATYF